MVSHTLPLVSTLSLGHAAYNNVSVDLRAAMPGDPTGSFQPQLEYLVLGAVLALFIVLIMRKLVWPLYVLDVYRAPVVRSVDRNPDGGEPPVGRTSSGTRARRTSGNYVPAGGPA